jgi:hypothetical protein
VSPTALDNGQRSPRKRPRARRRPAASVPAFREQICRPGWQLDSFCLLNSTWTLEDVDDVEGLIASVVDRYLGRRGAYLSAGQREDLDAYLLGEVWRLYKKFEPSKASTALSLSTYLTRRLDWCVTDWYRQTFTDSRYRATFVVREVVSLEDVNEQAVEADVSILACLSHTGRQRFERYGLRIAFDESKASIAERYGMDTQEVSEELEALGHELRSLS